MTNPKPFDLDQHIVPLLREEPFFAALSRRLEKVATTAIPTAGVRFNEDRCRFEMLYNPLADLHQQDPNYVKAIPLHEFYPIVLLHVTTRLPDGKMTKKWNIATDLAINSELTVFERSPETLSGFVVHSSLLPIDKALIPTIGPFEAMVPHLSSEEYMALLPDKSGKEAGAGQQGQGGGDPDGESPASSSDTDGQGDPDDGSGNGFDDHSDWGDSNGTDEKRKIAEERLREAVKEAFVEAQAKGFGSISQTMKKTIKEVITPKVNWRAILRSFVKASQRADKSSTIKRLNRRYPHIHPGKKARRQAKIAVSIDQSGSVSDTMLSAFYCELDKLAQLADFTIVPFDTEVSEDHVHVWKKGERRSKERYLSGGTCFNAPTRWVNENKFDGHIVLTDMEAPKPVPSHCQRMWMTTKACADRPYFQTTERVIAIDE